MQRAQKPTKVCLIYRAQRELKLNSDKQEKTVRPGVLEISPLSMETSVVEKTRGRGES